MKPEPYLNENDIRRVISIYGDTVYKIAFSYCKNYADADDIYQDVFTKYFQNSKPFESNNHEKAWLIRVTINFSKSFLRSSWHKRMLPLTEDQAEAVYMEDSNDLLETVLSLPIKYREVIHLYYYEGYSTNEIAAILNRRETTIRTQLQRGRDRLRLALKEGLSYE